MSPINWPVVLGLTSSTPADETVLVDDPVVMVVVPVVMDVTAVVEVTLIAPACDLTPGACVTVAPDPLVAVGINGTCNPDSSMEHMQRMSSCSCLHNEKTKKKHKTISNEELKHILYCVLIVKPKQCKEFKIFKIT